LVKGQAGNQDLNLEQPAERELSEAVKKGRRKVFALNLSSPRLPVAKSLPANLAYMAQAPNRNIDIIEKTTRLVNQVFFVFFAISAPKPSRIGL
jgi:hypothetical protein